MKTMTMMMVTADELLTICAALNKRLKGYKGIRLGAKKRTRNEPKKG